MLLSPLYKQNPERLIEITFFWGGGGRSSPGATTSRNVYILKDNELGHIYQQDRIIRCSKTDN